MDASTDADADALVLLVQADGPTAWADRWGRPYATALADAQATQQAQVVAQDGDAPRRLIVVAADAPEGDEGWRWAAAKAAGIARSLKLETVTVAVPPEAPASTSAAITEGFGLGVYAYTRYRTGADAPDLDWSLDAPTEHADAIRRALTLVESTALARDLVNRSPDEKLPPEMADLVEEAAQAAGLEVDVWDRERIEAEGMGGLLGVARGSVDPPRFVVLRWTPEGADGPPVVLVGKTVVYDTGGLSLKPTKGSMDKMKADMAGGAAVVGAMTACARLGLDVPVIALLPMSDNRPGVKAYVPGDVLRMHSGATVEVMNTDAEGRLLLADALSYARMFEPRLVIDVATLTGAQGVALGDRVAAVIGRPDAEPLTDWVREAGDRTGDLAWPLPLYPHYREQLKSDVADLSNVGGPMAGTISAAAFLDHFTRDAGGDPSYPWLHLDIARPSFLDTPYGYRPKGATGFGVRLLVDLLESVAAGTSPLDA